MRVVSSAEKEKRTELKTECVYISEGMKQEDEWPQQAKYFFISKEFSCKTYPFSIGSCNDVNPKNVVCIYTRKNPKHYLPDISTDDPNHKSISIQIEYFFK
jgi:hypothetical protein